MRRLPFVVVALNVLGAVLSLGAASGVVMAREGAPAAMNLPPRFVEWVYAAASLLLVGALLAAALWRRHVGRWPFDERDEGWSSHPATLPLSAALGGLGCGLYAGLLHDLDLGPVHVATAVAYFGLVPLAALLVALSCSAGRAVLAAAAFMLLLELGAQLGVGLDLGARAGRGYWDDITAVNAGFLAGWLALIGLVAAGRGLRRRPPPDASPPDQAP